MIELSNTTAVTIPVGGTVTFDKVLTRSNCGAECFNFQIPTRIKLRSRGVYDIEFHGNITSDPAAPIQLAIAVGGAPLVQTAMNATPAAAGDLVNVSAGTYLRNCCCDMDSVSVINTGTAPVTLAPNSSFRVAQLHG